MGRHRATFATAVLLSGCLVAPVAAGAGAIVEADAGAVHERNVNLAHRGQDRKHDTAAQGALSVGVALPVGDRHLASVTADARGIAWERFSGLDSVAGGLTVGFRSKLGLGAAAPWVRVAGSFAREEYEIDVRDGWRYRVGPAIGARFGARWDVQAEYAYEERVADYGRRVTARLPGDVFDLASHAVSARASFLASELVALTAGYTFREGDVVSTTPRNPELFAISTALTADPAFGRDAVAYKVDAIVHTVTAGISVALGRRVSFNLGYDHHVGLARRDVTYGNDVYRAGLMFSY